VSEVIFLWTLFKGTNLAIKDFSKSMECHDTQNFGLTVR